MLAAAYSMRYLNKTFTEAMGVAEQVAGRNLVACSAAARVGDPVGGGGQQRSGLLWVHQVGSYMQRGTAAPASASSAVAVAQRSFCHVMPLRLASWSPPVWGTRGHGCWQPSEAVACVQPEGAKTTVQAGAGVACAAGGEGHASETSPELRRIRTVQPDTVDAASTACVVSQRPDKITRRPVGGAHGRYPSGAPSSTRLGVALSEDWLHIAMLPHTIT